MSTIERGLAKPPAEQPLTKPLDYGQQIACDYWRTTEHVFYPMGTSQGPWCYLCRRLEQFVPHKQAAPVPPSTLTKVTDLVNSPYGHSHRSLNFELERSCGHMSSVHGTPREKLPKVGEVVECWTCESAVRLINFPDLPDEVRQQIDDAAPKCAKCGSLIKTVVFETVRYHSFEVDVDPHTGQLDAESEYEDTIMCQPSSGANRSTGAEGYDVLCENGHEWYEPRLVFKGPSDTGNNEHRWRINPPPATEQTP
jgi:hypothetical protein